MPASIDLIQTVQLPYGFQGEATLVAFPRRYLLQIKKWGIHASAFAFGFPDHCSMVVLAGSQAYKGEATSHPRGTYGERRGQLIKEGILRENNETEAPCYVFTRDCWFSAPSAASSVVLAMEASNGRELWKDKNGVSLNDKWRQVYPRD